MADQPADGLHFVGVSRPLAKVPMRQSGMAAKAVYKVTDEDGFSFYSRERQWDRPEGDCPGQWQTVDGALAPYENGLHLYTAEQILWGLGPVIWEAEYEGETKVEDAFVIVRQARLLRQCGEWNERVARLFASDCAERVLKIVNETCCVAAVLAARRFALGLISDDDMAAARACAGAALVRVRSTAVRNAIRSCVASVAIEMDDVLNACEFATTAAANRDTEREWQDNRLLQYVTGEIDLDRVRESIAERH